MEGEGRGSRRGKKGSQGGSVKVGAMILVTEIAITSYILYLTFYCKDIVDLMEQVTRFEIIYFALYKYKAP